MFLVTVVTSVSVVELVVYTLLMSPGATQKVTVVVTKVTVVVVVAVLTLLRVLNTRSVLVVVAAVFVVTVVLELAPAGRGPNAMRGTGKGERDEVLRIGGGV